MNSKGKFLIRSRTYPLLLVFKYTIVGLTLRLLFAMVCHYGYGEGSLDQGFPYDGIIVRFFYKKNLSGAFETIFACQLNLYCYARVSLFVCGW